MPRPICTKCAREMRCKQNGYWIHLTAGGQPYQVWAGDRWGCDGCGASVVTGYGASPVSEHHEENFPRVVAGAQLEIVS